MGLKYFMVPHKFSMVVTLENFKAEKLLNMKGTKVRCEITRGTKMVCTYWEPAGAVTPGVVQFDQQMQQTVTLYKGNTKWNPKYYEFKLVSISNEYGKKTLATTSINLAQLASLDPDSPVKKDLALPVEGKVVGKLNVILECKYKSIGVKKQGTPSEAASDTDFELMEKPKITKPLAALMEEELIEEEEGSSPIPAPAPRSPSPIPAPSTTAMSPVKENVYATQPARASPVVSALKSNDDKASPARSPRDVSFKQNKAITKAGSFLVFHPVKYEVVKKNKGLRIPFIPLLAITAAGVAAALNLNDGNDHARRCGTKHKVKRGDSVHALGKKYGVSTKELLALNKTVQEPGSKAAQRKGSQLIEGEQLCVRV